MATRQYSKQDLRILSAQGLDAELPAPRKRKNEEFAMQVALVSWWSAYCKTVGIPEFLLWHTPNSAVYGGSKETRERMGAMLKRMGQRSGVPDLFLAWPRELEGEYGIHRRTLFHFGLFLELKSPKGIISPEQTDMLAELQKQGYQTAVCRTLEDAQNVIRDYLK